MTLKEQDSGGHAKLMGKLIKSTKSSAEVQIRLKQIHTTVLKAVRRNKQQGRSIKIEYKVKIRHGNDLDWRLVGALRSERPGPYRTSRVATVVTALAELAGAVTVSVTRRVTSEISVTALTITKIHAVSS